MTFIVTESKLPRCNKADLLLVSSVTLATHDTPFDATYGAVRAHYQAGGYTAAELGLG